MKLYQKVFLLLFTMLLGNSLSNATLRIVDGIGGGGKYAKLSDAVTAANVGDSIFIQPGTYTETQPVSVNKRLIIFGNGYKNAIASTILKYQISIVSGGSGSIIRHLKFETVATGVSVNSVDNCIIADSYFDNAQIYLSSSKNDTVMNNIIITKNSTYNILVIDGTSSNIVIASNIFDSGIAGTTYGIHTTGTISNIKCFNNFFSDLTYPFNPAQGNGVFIIASNIFFKTGSISSSATSAILYSGNWLFNVANTPTQPANGEANISGDPQFVRLNVTTGFAFTGDTATDSDLRIKASASTYPSSPIDGGYPAVAPMGSGYVDVLQQPGAVNTNRADAGIFGGPLPFSSIYTPSTIPSATSITISPSGVRPKGTVSINVSGGFGSSAEPLTTEKSKIE